MIVYSWKYISITLEPHSPTLQLWNCPFHELHKINKQKCWIPLAVWIVSNFNTPMQKDSQEFGEKYGCYAEPIMLVLINLILERKLAMSKNIKFLPLLWKTSIGWSRRSWLNRYSQSRHCWCGALLATPAELASFHSTQTLDEIKLLNDDV